MWKMRRGFKSNIEIRKYNSKGKLIEEHIQNLEGYLIKELEQKFTRITNENSKLKSENLKLKSAFKQNIKNKLKK